MCHVWTTAMPDGEGQHVERHDQRVESSGAALHHPDDIHRIGEYGRPGIDQAASRIVVSRVAPRQQRHADERNEDCDDDPHRTAFAEKERHDDGHHQRIEKIDGGGHAARYVIVRAQQSQRRGGVHQAQAGQPAEVAPRDAEVAFQQQRHRRHDGRREQHAVEENRRRGHARMKQRDREERDQPERGRRDNGVEHSLYITYVTHMFDVFSRWRLSWPAPCLRAVRSLPPPADAERSLQRTAALRSGLRRAASRTTAKTVLGGSGRQI